MIIIKIETVEELKTLMKECHRPEDFSNEALQGIIDYHEEFEDTIVFDCMRLIESFEEITKEELETSYDNIDELELRKLENGNFLVIK